MKYKKLGTVIATAAITSTLLNPLAQQQAQAQAQCGDVHLITANGTGGSGESIRPEDRPVDLQGMIDRLNQDYPGQVTHQQITYPSGAGAIYSMLPTADNSKTYGLSRLIGDMNGIDHIKDFAADCPNTMLAFAGYSQGASVMGDLAALIANGAVDGVGADRILGAILIADPGRSGDSQYSGASADNKYWIPHPAGARYQRNGEVSTSTVDYTVGWTGQRSLPFTGIEGRVISICNDHDMACSVGTGSIHRDVADMSDKDIWPNKSYRSGSALSKVVFTNLDKTGPILADMLGGLVLNEDYSDMLVRAQQRADALPIDNPDRGVLINAIQEIEKILDLLHRDELYGSGVSDRQVIAHMLHILYPQVKDLIPDFPEKDKAMPAIEAALGGLAAFSGVPSDVAARVEQPIAYLGAFPKEHFKYFGEYQVEGQSGVKWAEQAMSAGVGNYLANREMILAADAGNSGSIEVAEANRKDDGLRSLLNYKDQGISVLGEDTEDYPVVSDGNTSWDNDLNKLPDAVYTPEVTPTPIIGQEQSNSGSVASGESTKKNMRRSSSKSRSSKATTTETTEESTASSATSTPSTTQPTTRTVTPVVQGPRVNTGGKVETPLVINQIASILL